MTRAAEPVDSSISDGQLLEEFLESRREEAFARLVGRHGPMVLGVCRSLLPAADAEDAAQAVFLTLALRASSLRQRTTLAGWLHRVAWYVARRSARGVAIRGRHEREAARMRQEVRLEEAPSIAQEALHAALEALPARYRLPLLLHYIEGRTVEETAALLGCTTNCAAVRLSRGRELLRRRIERGGAALAGGAMRMPRADAALSPAMVHAMTRVGAFAFGSESAASGTPPSARALAQQAVRMLRWARLKASALATLAVLLAGGVGVAAYSLATAAPQRTLATESHATSATQPLVQTVPAEELAAARQRLVDVRRDIEVAGRGHGQEQRALVDAAFEYVAAHLQDDAVASFDPLAGFDSYIATFDTGRKVKIVVLQRGAGPNHSELIVRFEQDGKTVRGVSLR